MDRSEALRAGRILAEYKRMVLLGRLRLPLAQARRLVGPDCAYHLYFRHACDLPVAPARRGVARRRAATSAAHHRRARR